MKSTNMLKLFNQEITRRTRGVRIFPNNASCLRLIRALSVEQRRCQMHDWICRGDG
jgi:putative transposase